MNKETAVEAISEFDRNLLEPILCMISTTRYRFSRHLYPRLIGHMHGRGCLLACHERAQVCDTGSQAPHPPPSSGTRGADEGLTEEALFLAENEV